MYRGRAFTPKATKEYEASVRDAYIAAYATAPKFEGDVAVDITMYFKRKNHGDVDNVSKSALDALNGVAWGDDRQVKRLRALLIFKRGIDERLEMSIREFDAEVEGFEGAMGALVT